jgi:hypothetical protein
MRAARARIALRCFCFQAHKPSPRDRSTNSLLRQMVAKMIGIVTHKSARDEEHSQFSTIHR